MAKVEWLIIEEESVALPRFDDHNGKSAKRRAMEAERKRESRKSGSCPQDVTDPSASDADRMRTREEKRREESKEPNGSVGKADRLPACDYDAVVSLYHEVLPELPSVRVMNDSRKRVMQSRWRWVLTSKKSDGTRRAETAQEALEWLRQFFTLARDNDFVMGRGWRDPKHAAWQADLEYLLSDRGLKQVVEKTRGGE